MLAPYTPQQFDIEIGCFSYLELQLSVVLKRKLLKLYKNFSGVTRMLVQETPLRIPIVSVSEESSLEDLKSAVIASFATAIDRGLSPSDAMATILEWAAQECARLQRF
jgi:hypothetical protein